MRNTTLSLLSFAGLAVLALTPTVSQARDFIRVDYRHGNSRYDDRYDRGRHDNDWRRDGNHHDDDWARGRWVKTRHNGAFGWWWVIDGMGWYMYNTPVYPYPVYRDAVRVYADQDWADAQRRYDEKKLNSFAMELSDIRYNTRDQWLALRDLSERVDTFHDNLYDRAYNARGIIRETEDLQAQIESRIRRSRW